MKNYKIIIVIILLSLTLIISHAVPIARYEGIGYISKVDVPLSIDEWTGRDISNQLNMDFDKDWNKFISQYLIHEYRNPTGQKILFILLDAGNFHHPNVCFTSAGFKIKELADAELNVAGRNFKAHALYTEKDTDSNLSLYWIIIDKKIAHNWIEQKLKQLYFSLFNRERVGLMVRLDIPAKENTIENTKAIAEKFIADLSQVLQPENADYIFGSSAK